MSPYARQGTAGRRVIAVGTTVVRALETVTDADGTTHAGEGWTLLVQEVNRWVPEAALLLEPFSFLPNVRVDDVMISFAAPGGSVGPHGDSYDVFLVQRRGKRR